MQGSINGLSYLGSVPQVLYTMFVPLMRNEGGRQSADRLHWLERELMTLCGGCTRYYPGQGFWTSPMSLKSYRDLVLPLHSVVTQGSQQEAQMVDLAVQAARVFEQEEVFLFAQPVWQPEPLALPDQVPAPTGD